MSLVGRGEECRVLDATLDAARRGESSTLVVRGEPGVGKSALLNYAVDAGADFPLIRLTGIASEYELGFAALHRLLVPMLDEIQELPTPQRDALNSAFGLAATTSPNTFLVGLGLISLAGHAAQRKQRLLAVIDDAHWIDRESLQVLAFWGRRIEAEGIALVFAVRTDSDAAATLESFQTLEVSGLAVPDAYELLMSSAASRFDREVADRIVTETDGNPLALIEIARDLSVEGLLGAGSALEPIPLVKRVEQNFARQVGELPPETQVLLLIAAADSTRDIATVWGAASVLGVEPNAIDAAIEAGLVSLNPSLSFKHPLVRSAVYGGSASADRRSVHNALASLSGEKGDKEREAWHLAAAAYGPDEDLASALERCALEARERGSHSSALAMFNRAAALSPLVERAAERRVEAAASAIDSGSPQQAQVLLASATRDLPSENLAAHAKRLNGLAFYHEARGADAVPLLLEAAVELQEASPSLARRTLLEAVDAALLLGNLTLDDRALTQAVAAAPVKMPSGTDPVVDALLDSIALWLREGFVAAAAALRSTLAMLQQADVGAEQLLPWGILIAVVARATWDEKALNDIMNRLIRIGRTHGDLQHVAAALWARAAVALPAARFTDSIDDFAAAADVYLAAGENPVSLEVVGTELLAWQGNETETRSRADAIIALGSDLRIGSTVLMAHHCLVLLDLGMRKYADAFEHALVILECDPTHHGNIALPDVIEAAARAGSKDVADAALERFTERASASGTAWARALLARSCALVGREPVEGHYVQSIELFTNTGLQFELARSRLVYGEWLRRENRRVEAREQLRVAYETFANAGAEAFATRASDELQATGERARRRTVETLNDLTPQETRIAQLAAQGDTNPEIAAQLFISASTVDYHLRKVYRKLSVTSRRQLEIALAAPAGVSWE